MMFPCDEKSDRNIIADCHFGQFIFPCQFAYKDAKNIKAFSPYILRRDLLLIHRFSISIILL